MDKEVVLALAGPIITALLGASGFWLQEWRQGRDSSFRRRQTLARSSEMVQFIEHWVRAQQQVRAGEELRDVHAAAQRQLDWAYAAVAQLPEEERPRQRLTLRRALLWYRPRSLHAWIAHLALTFFVLLAFMVTLGIFVPQPDTKPPTTATIIGMYIILLTPVFATRAWAVSVDDRDAARLAAQIAS